MFSRDLRPGLDDEDDAAAADAEEDTDLWATSSASASDPGGSGRAPENRV